MLYETVQLERAVDEKRSRELRRLSARELRAQLRERRRAEEALFEMRFARLC